jgi:hypothetical protein
MPRIPASPATLWPLRRLRTNENMNANPALFRRGPALDDARGA